MANKNTRTRGTAELFELYADENKGFSIKDENAKLQKTEDIIYVIWNLPCYITCPNATEACKVACYASAPENDYRQASVIPARFRNLAACTGDNADTFVSRMIEALEKAFNSKKYKSRKEIRVRIHESGDFFSKEYAIMWLEIAKHFSDYNNVVFMAYTKSFAFFDGVQLPNNFVLRASIWQDTKTEDLDTIKKNAWPLYIAIPEKMIDTVPENYIKCDCENCSTCKKHCFTRDNALMYTLLHGRDAKKLENDIPRLTDIVNMFK